MTWSMTSSNVTRGCTDHADGGFRFTAEEALELRQWAEDTGCVGMGRSSRCCCDSAGAGDIQGCQGRWLSCAPSVQVDRDVSLPGHHGKRRVYPRHWEGSPVYHRSRGKDLHARLGDPVWDAWFRWLLLSCVCPREPLDKWPGRRWGCALRIGRGVSAGLTGLPLQRVLLRRRDCM